MKRRLFLLLIPFFLFSACDSWLDIVPEEDIATIDTDFETRDGANAWLESCYAFLMRSISTVENAWLFGTDEVMACDYVLNRWEGFFPSFSITAGLQNSLDPYDDVWSHKEVISGSVGRTDFYTAISLCNIFINKIDQVYNMENREKSEWKAEVKALKAYYYFELVRHYGPIVLLPENIDPNLSIKDMKLPRNHVDSCFLAIVRLCDDAAEVLPHFNEKATNRRTYFSKEAALALKARALLYQASDLFNGNQDYVNFTNKNGELLFSATKDKNKWLLAAEAAEAAIEACREGGKKLVDNQSGMTDLQTHMLNIEASTQTYNYDSDEVLFLVKRRTAKEEGFWTYTLPNLNSDKNKLLQGTTISPSMKMVEMFYTDNGLPIDQDPSYAGGSIYNLTREKDPKYTDVVALDEDIPVLHTRREPRFYADIAADRCYWRLGRSLNDLYKVEAYQGENFGLKARRLTSTVPENLTGYWMKKWSCSKVDITNYETGEKAMGVAPYPVIRVAELYLIAAEAWNEYEGPGENVYRNINVVRKRAGIPDVEDSWAMARDKSKVSNQDGMREIIHREWNIEFAFEGMRFWNLRRWKTAHSELNEKVYGWIVTGNNTQSFYNNGNGPVVVDADRSFVAPRDYLWPIRSEEIMISGCKQNPGW
ncbi:RagB/SusD family nutrient uptake outer membrane protein [Butyricimonas faecihominis]|uniref:RagB/SusD family nutrient uptake outer membrane protein n=1 Tax=Butyricimonas faecihominis TaxID=1472416 RepID=UPI00266F7DF3|nr:RagB/SusD family nutrient uptake outer membrane protein [Butyricimonas faecihominis]